MPEQTKQQLHLTKQQLRENMIRGSTQLPKTQGEQDIFKARVAEYTEFYSIDDQWNTAYIMAQRAFINDRLDGLMTHLENRNTVHKSVVEQLILLMREINNA